MSIFAGKTSHGGRARFCIIQNQGHKWAGENPFFAKEAFPGCAAAHVFLNRKRAYRVMTRNSPGLMENFLREMVGPKLTSKKLAAPRLAVSA